MTDDQLCAAAALMAEQHYEAARMAYEWIVMTQPEHAALAAKEVGAAFFFLQRYDEAIRWYERAEQLGCDAQTVAANIEEAKQALGSTL